MMQAIGGTNLGALDEGAIAADDEARRQQGAWTEARRAVSIGPMPPGPRRSRGSETMAAILCCTEQPKLRGVRLSAVKERFSDQSLPQGSARAV